MINFEWWEFPELEKIAFDMGISTNQYGSDIRLPGIDKMPKLRNIVVTKDREFNLHSGGQLLSSSALQDMIADRNREGTSSQEQ